MNLFDYVIVGAGSAGCILAYRLAAAGHRVCVLEAGPPDRNPYIRLPGGFMKTSTNRRLTWSFAHEGSPQVYGRSIPFIQGKTLGGSSAINGMVFNRGQSSDFDLWAREGNPGWEYQSVLPYFRRLEHFIDGGEDEFRGRRGPVPVATIARRDPVCDSFIRAAMESGIPPTSDYNGRTQTGVGYTQANIYKGKRWSTAHSYLHPARRRFGVKVVTNALVRRIVIEGGRASGVEYSHEGSERLLSMRARVCTIVSAGTVNTAKLLQLSGIGPAKLLQEIGIPVVADLAGVGANLSDHYAARLVAHVHEGVDTINARARGLPLIRELASWATGKPSILSTSVMSVYAFYKVNPASLENDYLVTFTPASLKGGATRVLDDVPGISSGAYRLRPESRGHVRITSKDVNAAPIVQPNYLQAESDRTVLIEALKRSRRILTSDAMRHIVKSQAFPENELRSDDEWMDFIRRYGMTTYHLVGTCKMGAAGDPLAVVDARLRVRGVQGLRVVDASVMPTTPSGNTNAATMMIAEKASDLILAEHPRH
jgi:choline dehydrogenase